MLGVTIDPAMICRVSEQYLYDLTVPSRLEGIKLAQLAVKRIEGFLALREPFLDLGKLRSAE